MTIANGVYKIATAMDANLVLDINGISMSNMANLMIHTPNDGNNQKFAVTTNGAHRQLYALHSGKIVEVYGTLSPVGGENVSQYTPNGGVNQKWAFQDFNASDGTPAVALICAANPGLAMDVSYALAKSGQNVFVAYKHLGTGEQHGDNQVFISRRTPIPTRSCPSPSG